MQMVDFTFHPVLCVFLKLNLILVVPLFFDSEPGSSFVGVFNHSHILPCQASVRCPVDVAMLTNVNGSSLSSTPVAMHQARLLSFADLAAPKLLLLEQLVNRNL